MQTTWVISDCHFGHKGVEKYRHQVRSSEENDCILLGNILTYCEKNDTLWMLGDCFTSKDSLRILYEISSRIKFLNLVLGNHDTEGSRYREVLLPSINQGMFNSIHGVYKGKGFWMTHTPMHPLELHGKINIHGHVHHHTIPDDRYVNVSVENTDMKPIKLNDILAGWRGKRNYAY